MHTSIGVDAPGRPAPSPLRALHPHGRDAVPGQPSSGSSRNGSGVATVCLLRLPLKWRIKLQLERNGAQQRALENPTHNGIKNIALGAATSSRAVLWAEPQRCAADPKGMGKAPMGFAPKLRLDPEVELGALGYISGWAVAPSLQICLVQNPSVQGIWGTVHPLEFEKGQLGLLKALTPNPSLGLALDLPDLEPWGRPMDQEIHVFKKPLDVVLSDTV